MSFLPTTSVRSWGVSDRGGGVGTEVAMLGGGGMDGVLQLDVARAGGVGGRKTRGRTTELGTTGRQSR
jgi:hypothetical protein